MKPIDIVVIVVVAVLVIAAFIYLAVRKFKGKSGCDCGGSCSTCGMCRHAADKQEQNGSSEEHTGPHCKNSNE